MSKYVKIYQSAEESWFDRKERQERKVGMKIFDILDDKF
jgi:hypothetical protein